MGIFKDSVVSKPGWWNDPVDHILDLFYLHMTTDRVEAYDVMSTTDSEAEKGTYLYLFGGTKDEKTLKGKIARATTKAKQDVAALGDPPPDPALSAVMTKYLDGLDGCADLIANQGALLIKREMMEAVFAGRWTPVTDPTIPSAHAEQCNAYGNKHFKKDEGVGSYLPYTDDRFLVKALEEKAIAHGLVVPGAYIFRFDTEVGYDGVNGLPTKTSSRAIRVDSVGSGGQHSHPFPETDAGIASFERYVLEEIIAAACNRDMDRACVIAKFLTNIRAARKEFEPKQQHIARVAQKYGLQPKDVDFVDCHFW